MEEFLSVLHLKPAFSTRILEIVSRKLEGMKDIPFLLKKGKTL